MPKFAALLIAAATLAACFGPASAEERRHRRGYNDDDRPARHYRSEPRERYAGCQRTGRAYPYLRLNDACQRAEFWEKIGERGFR